MMLVVGSKQLLGRTHDCKIRGVNTAQQVQRQVHVVKPNHLAGAQAQPDARGGVRRVRACIFPHERVYRARALLGHKKGEKTLPAEGGEDRLTGGGGGYDENGA
jgi:hypothetical protein